MNLKQVNKVSFEREWYIIWNQGKFNYEDGKPYDRSIAKQWVDHNSHN